VTAGLRSRLELGLLAFAGAALLGSCLLSPEQSGSGPVLCPFRLATGLPCPGCGLTRSFVAMGHGDVREAFRQHAFGPIFYGIFAAFVALKLVELVRGRLLLGRAALAKSPEDRFADAAEMAVALEAAFQSLDHLPAGS
jgi:hypothetical protein